jgi:hypothetical protein
MVSPVRETLPLRTRHHRNQAVPLVDLVTTPSGVDMFPEADPAR